MCGSAAHGSRWRGGLWPPRGPAGTQWVHSPRWTAQQERGAPSQQEHTCSRSSSSEPCGGGGSGRSSSIGELAGAVQQGLQQDNWLSTAGSGGATALSAKLPPEFGHRPRQLHSWRREREAAAPAQRQPQQQQPHGRCSAERVGAAAAAHAAMRGSSGGRDGSWQEGSWPPARWPPRRCVHALLAPLCPTPVFEFAPAGPV